MATIISIYRESDRDYNVICPICQDEFNDPVIIECHHSFCRTCIEAWINQTNNTQHGQHGPESRYSEIYIPFRRQFNCPSCKSINKIPRNGVAGFPKSFYIEQIKDTKAQSQSSYPMCAKHTTEDLRFYCIECETTMCRDCKVLKHEGHTAECVNDVANDMRAKLRENINRTDADLRKLNQAKDGCKIDKTKVIELKQSARNMVKNQVQEMKRTIDNIAGMLDQNICSYFQTYEDEIDKETSEADFKSDGLQRFKTIVIQEIKSGSDHGVIGKYRGFLKERGQIVVADRKPPNPDYKTKLANVYRKGSINVTELQSMVGTVAGKAKTVQQESSKVGSTSQESNTVPALSGNEIKETDAKREEIELSTAAVAVFTKADKRKKPTDDSETS